MKIHTSNFLKLRLCLVLAAFVFPAMAFSIIATATSISFNVDGVITKPDGSALEEPTVIFQIDIKSPSASGSCLLYREQASVTMTASSGYFSIPVGKSSNLASGGYTLSQVLGNEISFSSLAGCTSGSTYTPGADDDRQIVISFTDSSGAHNFSSQTIKAVPFAIRAKTAESVSGFASGSLLKVDPAVSQTLNANTALSQAQYDEFWRLVKNPSSGIQSSAAITQSRVESIFTRYSILDSILNGSFAGNSSTATALATAPGACPAGQYVSAMSANGAITCGVPAAAGGTVTNVSSANAYLSVASGATTPVLTLNVGTAANTVAAGNDARFTDSRAPNGTAGGDLSGTYPNPSVAKIAGKSVVLTSPANGEILKYNGTNFVNAPVPADTTKLPLAGGTMSGAIDMNSQNLTNVGFMTMSANKSLHLSNNASDPSSLGSADKGKMWFDSTNGVIKFWNGTTAQSLGVAGSGLSNFNSQTGSTQTLAIGTSSLSPTWSSASNTHTLNIPMASTASVTAGLLSKTDYDTFTAKLGTATAFSGDVSGTYAATSVDKIKGKSVSATVYAAGQTLRYDGTNWINTPLNFSDLANRPTTVAGYGITDAQSNALADGKIFVGNSGNVASPVALSGDATLSNTGVLTLATVPITKGGTGVTSFLADKLVTTSATGALQTSSCGVGQVISFTAGGAIACSPVSDSSKLPLIGGTMTGAINMGTQDITNVGSITMTSGKSLLLSNTATDPTGFSTADKGRVWFNSTSGTIKYYDGSATQSLLASGSTLSNATTFAGDVSGTYNALSVDKIKGKAVTTSAFSAGQVLRFDGTNWSNQALNFSDLSVKPTTLAGYGISDGLSNSLTNGAIWVGNASNVAAPVTLSGDATISNTGVVSLATVPIAKGGTGATSFGANKLVTTTTGGTLQSSNCGLNQVMSFDGSGFIKCSNVSDLANMFLDGGNSPTAAMTLGTLTAQNLNFATNGVQRMTVTSDGSVGIGTSSPSSAVGLTVVAPAAGSAVSFQNNSSSGLRPTLSVANADPSGYAANITGAVKISGTATVAGAFVVDAIRQPATTPVSGTSITIPDLSKSVFRITLNSTTVITLPPTSGVPTDQMYTLIVKVKQDAGITYNLSWNWAVGDSVVWDGSSTGPALGRTAFYRFFTIGGEGIWYASKIYQ